MDTAPMHMHTLEQVSFHVCPNPLRQTLHLPSLATRGCGVRLGLSLRTVRPLAISWQHPQPARNNSDWAQNQQL
eukprot:359501-Chlamydomonas_euryale.AAC.9